MTAATLSGGPLATEIKTRVRAAAEDLTARGITPTLAVVVATDDGSTHWYVRSIAGAAAKAAISCRVSDLGAGATADVIAAELERLSEDPAVHGIILQTPLPPGVAAPPLLARIAPHKDVDGANPLSLGRLVVGERAFPPATARAVVELLDHHDVALAGRHIAVVGRSAVVGKPLLHLLLGRDATVTACHSRSKPLADYTRSAAVVVVAAGSPGLLTLEHVDADAIVIDVGTNVAADGRLVGDVDPAIASTVAALSPVPGGVGSVTTALLLQHTVEAAGAAEPLSSW